MRQRRSLFEIIFGRPKNESSERTMLRLLSGYSPTFSAYTGEAYEYDVVRSAVDAIARNAAKLRAKHVRRIEGNVQQTHSKLERLLSTRPNPYMDAYSFLYKVVTQLYMRNNAFVYIDLDPITGEVRAFYPVLAASVDLLEGPDKLIYARFRFFSGQKMTLPYEDLIHLRRFYFEHDFYGADNTKALRSTLELVKAGDEGIINAIKSSAFLRGILKFTNMLKPDDIKEQRDKFVKDYLDITNNGGVAATDAKAEYIPLESKPQMVDAKQMAAIKEKVWDYFGVNDKIVRSTYNENEWNAFYESTLEPLAIQMSLAFSAALFTERELGHGNEIVFEANRLQYASMGTKLALVSMVDRGAMTPNEWRSVLNLGPIDGGDKPIRRLDTAEVGGDMPADEDEPATSDPDEGSDDDEQDDDSDPGSETEGS